MNHKLLFTLACFLYAVSVEASLLNRFKSKKVALMSTAALITGVALKSEHDEKTLSNAYLKLKSTSNQVRQLAGLEMLISDRIDHFKLAHTLRLMDAYTIVADEPLIFTAAAVRARKITRFLLDEGFDLRTLDKHGRTLLDRAACSLDHKMLEELIDAGCRFEMSKDNDTRRQYEVKFVTMSIFELRMIDDFAMLMNKDPMGVAITEETVRVLKKVFRQLVKKRQDFQPAKEIAMDNHRPDIISLLDWVEEEMITDKLI